MKSIIARTTATKRFGKLLWAVLILQHHSYHSTTHAAAPESFCGTNWADAEKNCFEPCPSGDDSDCTTDGHKCYGYTGCSVATDNGAEEEEEEELENPYRNNMCGATWIEAMLTCSTPCGTTSCPSGQVCFAATGCDTPLAPIVSNMLMSLLGDNFPSLRLGNIEQGVFSEGVLEFLAQRMEEERVSINRANVVGQSYIGNNGRRRGRQRMLQWNDTITGSTRTIELSLEQQQKRGRRHLPTSSSAIDVSMTITGEYRPPPYKDIDLIIEESINGAARTLVQDFRTRGRNRGTQFFESVNALEAVSVADATPRPTVSPTTMKPTSLAPTLEPSDSPTRSPSSSPTRAFDQMVQTGYDTDLYIDTARSFGNIFEIKTKPDAETLMIKGLSFYTASAGRVSYEVYSKEGSWVGHEGQLESFDKVAEGRIRSRGSCDAETAANCDSYFVNIPFEKFTQAAVRGGGGSRSFYITLSTNDIMYQRSSYSGEGGFQLQAETQDIEIYDGAGVTVYPFSEATEDRHNIKPRGFLGQIWYERNPCEDGGMERPCTTRAPLSLLTPPTPDPTAVSISQESMEEGTIQQPATTQITTPPPTLDPSGMPSSQEPTKDGTTQQPTIKYITSQPISLASLTFHRSPKPVVEYSSFEDDEGFTSGTRRGFVVGYRHPLIPLSLVTFTCIVFAF
mmetsp:Transcript_33474/g.72349  ORF Transcript_33474/g.72349 Transcript_33474/m.72349 type:complete len:679 (-) Transcript_33474:476-2512(-)